MGLTTDTAEPRAFVRERRSALVQRFRAAPAGQIPNGRGKGTVLLGTGGPLAALAAGFSRALLWRGKVVDGPGGKLKNLVSPLEVRAFAAKVYEQGSWLDGAPCIVLDYSKTSLLARKVRDEIREVAPDVFLGLVFLGRRHVLDFTLDFRDGGRGA
jgi:hypothetical protein